MTTARACVVLSTIAAGLCAASVLRLPLFELKMDSIKSSVTQSLFTADIYTPAFEKHVSTHDFTEKCEKLQTAFAVAQGSTIAAVALLALAMICGVLHLAPSFTKTNHHVRQVCGTPICLLLLLAVIAMGINGYILREMYEKDTWCKVNALHMGTSAPMYVQGNAASGILRQPVRLAMPPMAVRLADARPLKLQRSAAIALGEVKQCNYFEDCFASYRDMGFERAMGYRVLWAALGVAAFAMVVEMMVMAVGASVVPQAGIAAETAALLHNQDNNDDRVI